ncbi:hypothetical protein LTR10_010118 [Elasticomyces elasticus]|nr:hypothetical protein LTR10_010118 [Elasticomyces elasticus]KAK4970408.1 hypothetical protein LTR42_008577 [Elasticomyces elasticus]
MPSSKKRKANNTVSSTEQGDSSATAEEAVIAAPLHRLVDRERAIEALDLETLQQLLLDATKTSRSTLSAVEAAFAEKKDAEGKTGFSYSDFMYGIEEYWDYALKHPSGEAFSDGFYVAFKTEDDMKQYMQKGITVADAYYTKHSALEVLCELSQWIVEAGSSQMGLGMQNMCTLTGELAKTMSHVVDRMTAEEVTQIRADEESQDAFKLAASIPFLQLGDALLPVTAAVGP